VAVGAMLGATAARSGPNRARLMDAATARRSPSTRCPYTSFVIVMLACPKISDTTWSGVPWLCVRVQPLESAEQFRAGERRHPLVGEHERNILAGDRHPFELCERGVGRVLRDDAVVGRVPASKLLRGAFERDFVVVDDNERGRDRLQRPIVSQAVPRRKAPVYDLRMADVLRKSVDAPDEVVEFPNVRTDIVHLGDLTVGRLVNEPGWRWSTDVRPTVGGELCQIRHVGFVISGRLGVDFPDRSSVVFGPGDVFEIPPGHDGYTVGDEPVVQIEWSGLRNWAGYSTHSRVLLTFLFTDVVGSTEAAVRVGDGAWRDLLSQYFEAVRDELERFGGREVKTTGDGMLITFDGPARAIQCAAAIRRLARGHGLQLRVGVHVGEVEVVGNDVRGVAVHEAARIMAAAGPDEILVSDITRTLAGPAGFAFEDRGTHALKGLDGEWHLAAFAEA